MVGRVTNFVEIGPFVAITVKAWKKLRSIMNPTFVTGWGLDMIWYSLFEDPNLMLTLLQMVESQFKIPCPNEKVFRPSCMVIDEVALIHLNTAEGLKNGVYKNGGEEMNWYKVKYKDNWIKRGTRNICYIYDSSANGSTYNV